MRKSYNKLFGGMQINIALEIHALNSENVADGTIDIGVLLMLISS